MHYNMYAWAQFSSNSLFTFISHSYDTLAHFVYNFILFMYNIYCDDNVFWQWNGFLHIILCSFGFRRMRLKNTQERIKRKKSSISIFFSFLVCAYVGQVIEIRLVSKSFIVWYTPKDILCIILGLYQFNEFTVPLAFVYQKI